MDLRPLLHLSRDSAMRDFGDDSLTTEGRALRDALMVATSANEPSDTGNSSSWNESG
jgi:hypothetical protein